MANGYDRNWVRMCHVINDFRFVHGHWPTRFRIPSEQLRYLQQLFTPEDFAKISAKIQLITDETAYRAEDEAGATCEDRHDIPRAAEWLGVHTKPHDMKKAAKPWWRFF
jgi:hypothetical protein